MGTAAPAIMAVTAIIAAGATVYSVAQQREAAKEAERLANKNAEAAAAETEEVARRAAKDAARAEALARAKSVASGVSGASADLYIQELEQSNKEQIAWIRKAGATNVDIIRYGGIQARRQGEAAAMGTAAGGISSASNSWYQGVHAGYWGAQG
jgi:hypothetical protein